MIQVVNKYKHTPTDHDIYIGRGSVFGNPYSHLDSKYGVIKTETREDAVRLYKLYFDAVMNDPDGFDSENERNKAIELQTAAYELLEEARNSDINLVCFCKPKPCHGDIIKEWLDSELNK